MSNPTEDGVLKDLMSRHWTKMGEAPREMLSQSAVVAWDENRAIFTGGYGEENDGIKDSVFVYNKETMQTETLPSMRQKRTSHCAVIVGGNLFAIGGYRDGYEVYDSIEVLDLNDPREWKQYPVSLIVARHSCSAVAINEHEVCIIGGTTVGGQTLNSVEILNISTQTISQGPPMLEPRSIFSAALVGDSIVVAGGLNGRMMRACEQLSIRVSPDEDPARWQPLHSSLTTERANHHGLLFGDCFVVAGGFISVFSESSPTTDVWNSKTGTWTPLPAEIPAELPFKETITSFVKLGEDFVCFVEGRNPSVHCLFSAKGLLEHQRRQIRFNELIADERTEIVIPLLLEGLGQHGWTSLFYECIRETNGRLIPR